MKEVKELTEKNLKKFRRILEAKKAGLLLTLGRQKLTNEKTADEIDLARARVDEALSIGDRTRCANLLRDVQAAISRFKEKTFGSCLSCRKGISLKRLNAIPWTHLCIRCVEDQASACPPPSATKRPSPPRKVRETYHRARERGQLSRRWY